MTLFRSSLLPAALTMLLLAPAASAADAWYVNAGASSSGDGRTWGTAFRYLQQGLVIANPGDQVWVAAGTYRPDQGPGQAVGNRQASFSVKAGVKVYGGFPPSGGNWTARNSFNYVTTLSGDLRANDSATVPGSSTWSENSYHVVTLSLADASSLLDGFTVTGGNANGTDSINADSGAGVTTISSNALGAAGLGGTLRNCRVIRNHADSYGGGLNVASHIFLSACDVSENICGGLGGGIYATARIDVQDSSLSNNLASNIGGAAYLDGTSMWRQCSFSGNHAVESGGAVYAAAQVQTFKMCDFVRNGLALPLPPPGLAKVKTGGACTLLDTGNFINCRFMGNQASDGGGAVYRPDVPPEDYHGNDTFINCLFSGNQAAGPNGQGGALYERDLTANNCTFASNSAGDATGGRGVFNYGSPGDTKFKNCILWGNTVGIDPALNNEIAEGVGAAAPEVTYSCIRRISVYPGVGNINSNPAFVNPLGDDGELGTIDDDLRLQTGSRGNDTGDDSVMNTDSNLRVTADLDGNGRQGDDPAAANLIRIDMGAYEYNTPPAPLDRVYVRREAPAGRTGASWQDAFVELREAVDFFDHPSAGLLYPEIWVATGTYKPTTSTGTRSASFDLTNGVTLLGGFAGTETDVSQRDPAANPTILSGDLTDNDVWPPAGYVNYAENSFHVVTGDGVTSLAVLDGFTISHGNADGVNSQGDGGGLFVLNGSPTVRNCRFERNRARVYGGAVRNDNGDSAFETCAFVDNVAHELGGAVFNTNGADATFSNCIFDGNLTNAGGSSSGGGAVASTSNSLNMFDWCTFSENSASGARGGAIHCSPDCGGLIIRNNCTFTDNTAADGGAVYHKISNADISDSVFEGNSATGERGGAIFNELAPAMIKRCRFTANTALARGGAISTIGNQTVYEQPGITACEFERNFVESETGGGGAINNAGASPVISDCGFTANRAHYGGAVVNSANSVQPIFKRCRFIGNKGRLILDPPNEVDANEGGAVMDFDGGKPWFVACQFRGNHAGAFGGVSRATGASTKQNFIGCLFSGNQAGAYGGVLHDDADAVAEFRNCTMYGNSAGINGNVLYHHSNRAAQIHNCILWENHPVAGDTFLPISGSLINITYSDVQEGWPGAGNINEAPLFADPHGPDGVPENGDANLHLLPGSPCIDSGRNDEIGSDVADLDDDDDDGEATPLDLQGYPRIDSNVDMGAYEGSFDCNSNHIEDVFDISEGTSNDCDSDGVPDECETAPNTDQDTDGILDLCDNCRVNANTDQIDSDGDVVGDLCDNCPNLFNPGQVDSNGNHIGDACDAPFQLGSRLDPPVAIAASVDLSRGIVQAWVNGAWRVVERAFYHPKGNINTEPPTGAWFAIEAGYIRISWRSAQGQHLGYSEYDVLDEVAENPWTVGVEFFVDYNQNQFEKNADVIIGSPYHAVIRYNSTILERRIMPGTSNPVQYYPFPDFRIAGRRALAEPQCPAEPRVPSAKVVVEYDDGPGGELIGFEVVTIREFGPADELTVSVGRHLILPSGTDDCRAVLISNYDDAGTRVAWQRGVDSTDIYPIRPEPASSKLVVAWYKSSILGEGDGDLGNDLFLGNCWPVSVGRYRAAWPSDPQVHIVDTQNGQIPAGSRVSLHVGAGERYCGAQVMYQAPLPPPPDSPPNTPPGPLPLSRIVNGVFEATWPGYSVVRFDMSPGGTGLCGDQVTFEVVASFDHHDVEKVPYTMDEDGTENDRTIYAAQPVDTLIGDQIMDCDHPIACATCEGPQACERLRPDCTEPRDCFDPGGTDGPQYAHGFLRSGKPYAANIHAATGQIFPVNATAMYPQARDGLLGVWWYARSRETAYQAGSATGGDFAGGIYWPHKVRDYNAGWPPEPSNADEAKEIVIASRLGGVTAGGLPKAYPQHATVYHAGTFENRATEMVMLPGWNPNDEHALLLPIANSYRVFAVRDDDPWDLNRPDGQVTHGHPWVLVQYPSEGDDPLNPELYGMDVFRVVAEDATYDLDYRYVAQNDPSNSELVRAGQAINPLFPVNFASPLCFDPPVLPRIVPDPQTYVIGDAVWVDNKGGIWAVEQTGDGIDQQPGDGWPSIPVGAASDADIYLWENWAADGGCQPWLTYARQDAERGNEPYPITYRPSWPQTEPDCRYPEEPKCARPLQVGETVDQSGQCGTITVLHDSVGQRILDPTLWVGEDVDTDGVDEDVPVSPSTMQSIDFQELPPHLYAGEIGGGGEWPDRIRYDYNGNGRLEFRGIMSDRDRAFLRQLGRPNPDTGVCEVPAYCAAIDELQALSQAQLTTPITQPASKHVTVGGSHAKPGWITVAYQNDEACVATGLPVSLEVWNVACPPYRSEIRVIQPDCFFNEKLVLQFAGDLGGEPENLVFQWQWANDPAGPWNNYNPPEDDDDMPPNYEQGQGLREIIIEGASEFTLSDSYWRVRYRGYPGCPGDINPDPDTPWPPVPFDQGGMTQISEWTSPQLAEGWVKRVVRGLNPFDQRFGRFHENATSTYVDMIGQAGKRYEQEVALNCDPNNLNAIGLIEAYSTVMNRAKKFSIELGLSYDPANQAIMLVAGKIADLYMLLGNEAFADGSDPTIGVFVGQGEQGAGYDPHAVFCFEDQEASLLDEELAMLRGRDEVRDPDRNADGQVVGTVYNRLPWNFTSGNGQVAYANNYQMIDVTQARQNYPQGHGDAWGHYLTAVKKFYDLLRHPVFDWVVDTEDVLVAGQPVAVGFKYERKFAAAAAAKARTGAAITSLTFREKYNADPTQQDGYPDNDEARAWGVADWGQRAGQGAYLDWVMANSLLPQEPLICPETGQPCDPTDVESCEDQFCVPDPNVEQGIQKIDRGTVRELHEIAASYTEMQATLDKADAGLNPLGLATNVVPFGLNPNAIQEGQTHFDQVYQRAVSAMSNAVTCFNYANENTRRLRSLQDEVERFDDLVEERELDYEARLIEVFGKPYPEDKGPFGTYPLDYDGPDFYHYMYVDPSSVLGPRQAGGTTTIGVTFHNPEVDPATGAVTTVTKTVQYNVSVDGLGLIRPEGWSDRPEPGELQFARAEIQQAVLRYQQAVDRYAAHLDQIEGQVDLLESLYNLNRNVLQVMRQGQATQQSLNEQILIARTLEQQFRALAGDALTVANATKEVLPSSIIIGLASGGDLTAPIRGTIKNVAAVIARILNISANVLGVVAQQRQNDKEWASAEQQILITGYQGNYQVEQQVQALRQLVRQTPSLRLEIYLLEEAIQQAAGRYQAALGRGLRLWEQRTAYRQRTADQTTRHRYRDMAFRVFRNDSLQKYAAQFDLAAQYVYLAAKVYDYETNLLGTHALGGRQFLTNIVKERTLGVFEGGNPLVGNGLAGSLAKMFTNFNLVLRPQLGFNSPAEMNRRFSLRWENERIAKSPQFDPDWKAFLTSARVADMNEVPEYRQYCKPLQAGAPISPNPSIVIEFETTVQSGINFFGHNSRADEVYPSSYDAIKLHSVGIRFLNYPTGSLNNQAEVYLVPVGTDILREPTNGTIREWHLLDQTLPVPFPLGIQQLSTPGWMPFDSLSGGSQAMIRRRLHPQITGLPAQGHDDDEDLRFHLTGRSVWNTKWVLIIPGSELLGDDPDEGIDTFINGPGGSTVGVRDIQLLFNSYGYAGTARDGGQAGEAEGDESEGGAGDSGTNGDDSGQP